MAFQLERDESIREGIRRVVREEVASASSLLSGEQKISRDEAIHEARKSIKKIRAISRLMRRKSHDEWSRENARLRDIAAKLSEFRDSAALIESFDQLRRRFRGKAGIDQLHSVRAALGRQLRETHARGDIADVIRNAGAALKKTHQHAKTWKFPRDGYDALAEGLRTNYRAGREALARVGKTPTGDNFHELRKRVKDHGYHVRLLEGLWSDVMEAREKSLKDLETWLGDDHNLVVLRERITAAPASFGKQEDVAMMMQLIEEYQAELRAKALPLAERIYQEKPSEFTGNLRQLWNTWKSEPESSSPESSTKDQSAGGRSGSAARKNKTAVVKASAVKTKAPAVKTKSSNAPPAAKGKPPAPRKSAKKAGGSSSSSQTAA
jgi:CHAD domain-containing protein